MNCSIDPAAAQQGVIGRVDDGVDVLVGDVALQEGDLHSVNLVLGIWVPV